jgi:oxygen-independent coproporphyrinogen-3 oxidase
MMWLPGQSIDDWSQSVRDAVAIRPAHVSMYLLELYPNAPLKEDMARSGWSLAPDDDAAEMYLGAVAAFDAAGYRQYEISNVALDGRESRHNLKYWTDGEWQGMGCGAHSTRHGIRWKNASATGDYIARVAAGGLPVVERRQMSAEERLGDALFTGLRLTNGIDVADVGRRYGVDVWQKYGADAQRFVDEGLLRREGSRVRLTREGMLVANEIMQIFV